MIGLIERIGAGNAGAILFLLVVGGLTMLARALAREERA